MHDLSKLAKKAFETYVKEGRIVNPPNNLPQELNRRKGVFVTIKKGEELRGCIGTYLPARENIACETIYNAVAACSKDGRFTPITEQELSFLSYEVYILDPPEKINDLSELDPERFGILVKKGLRSALLLPGLKGIDTPLKQFEVVCRKAGILNSFKKGDIEIFKFSVQKYEEE